MKVTVCELDNRPRHASEAWQRLTEHVAARGPDLVLLPEMPFDEWLAARRQVDPERWRLAAERHADRLAQLDELGVPAVLATCPVLEDERRLNRAFLWTGLHGPIGIHDKRYLPDEEGYWEASWYDRGDGGFEAVEVDAGSAGTVRLGVQICTDMWFFDHAREYGRRGAQLLCVPRATPVSTLDKWVAGGQAAAVVSGAYCLSSNLTHPPAGPVDPGGRAWVIDPDGEVVVVTDADRPFVTVDIDLSAADRAKATYPRYCD